jgi:hypothetical protein
MADQSAGRDVLTWGWGFAFFVMLLLFIAVSEETIVWKLSGQINARCTQGK